jgi:hypothetical protein
MFHGGVDPWLLDEVWWWRSGDVWFWSWICFAPSAR